MPLFRMKAEVIYYFTVEAENKDEACEIASKCEFENDRCYNSTEIYCTEHLPDNCEDWRKEPIMEPVDQNWIKNMSWSDKKLFCMTCGDYRSFVTDINQCPSCGTTLIGD